MTALRRAIVLLSGSGALLLASAGAQAAKYQVYEDAACAPNAQCGIDFKKVPEGKTLKIDKLSCYVRFSDKDELSAAQLVVVNKDGSRDFAVTPELHFQDDPKLAEVREQVFVSNDSIRAVAEASQFFRAYAQTATDDGEVGTVSQFSCGISGDLK